MIYIFTIYIGKEIIRKSHSTSFNQVLINTETLKAVNEVVKCKILHKMYEYTICLIYIDPNLSLSLNVSIYFCNWYVLTLLDVNFYRRFYINIYYFIYFILRLIFPCFCWLNISVIYLPTYMHTYYLFIFYCIINVLDRYTKINLVFLNT